MKERETMNTDLLNQGIPQDERKIYELSVKEFKKVMIECFEMLKQREIDTSTKEYNRVSKGLKPDEIFIRNGQAISKEY